MAISWLGVLYVNAGGAAVEVGVEATDHPAWRLRRGRDELPADQDQLLPLLQPGHGGSWREVRDRVASRLAEAGVDPSLVETFPFELAVLGADLSRSAVWLRHAAPWRPHVRDRYAMAGLREQFARMVAGDAGSLPLPPSPLERDEVLRALWRSLGAAGRSPSWSSGLLDAAVRWSLDEGTDGVRRLWLGLFRVLADDAPNVLHWNLFDAFWIAACRTGLASSLVADPPEELSRPLGVARALLVLRFLPLDGELGARVRHALDGFVLAQEVDGRRLSPRFDPRDLLAWDAACSPSVPQR